MIWISTKEYMPADKYNERELMFIAKPGITEERIGIYSSKGQYILLKRTEILMTDVLYWLLIPKEPK